MQPWKKNTHTKLFIVESPIKVKTIEKFLGGDYIIRASVGHIADIPERDGTVDVSNAFASVQSSRNESGVGKFTDHMLDRAS